MDKWRAVLTLQMPGFPRGSVLGTPGHMWGICSAEHLPQLCYILSLACCPPSCPLQRGDLTNTPSMRSLPTQKPPGTPHCQLVSLAAFVGGLFQPCLPGLLSPQWAIHFRRARTLTYSRGTSSPMSAVAFGTTPPNCPQLPPECVVQVPKCRCPRECSSCVFLVTGRGRSCRGTDV